MVSKPISFLVPFHAPQVHYFLGTCEAHRPTHFSMGYENYQDDNFHESCLLRSEAYSFESCWR